MGRQRRLVGVFKSLACLSSLSLAAGFVGCAETVNVRSGNGSLGGRDSSVTFLLGPSTGNLGHTLGTADFTSAQTGPNAYIVSPNPLWIPGLSGDSSAKWIGTNANSGLGLGNTALYAVSFQIANAFVAASMQLNYAVDDAIGDTVINNGPNSGVYLNGSVACGSGLGFSQQHAMNCGNVSSLLHVGTNWLYIEDGNAAGPPSPAGLLFSATITTTDAPAEPSINSGGVVGAASYSPGAPVAPGSIAAVFGNFLVGSPFSAPGLPLPTSMSGVAFQIGSDPVPLFFVSSEQADIQVPWELAGQSSASITASANGQVIAPQTVKLSTFAPGIFSTNGNGAGQGAILNASYQIVDSSHPALAGDVIQIYCTGLGPVTNQPATGSAAGTTPLSVTTTTPSVTIGGVQAPLIFSGLTPGDVGLYQVNVQVPAGTTTGTVSVTISIGGVTSNSVTISIQPAVVPNPQPLITGLSPTSAPAGSGPFTLTISGSGFISSSSVTFNGIPHLPSLISSSQLSISLTAADLPTSGTFAVVVTNPPPGGGLSNTAVFSVTPSVEVINIAGTWQGTWRASLGANGTVMAILFQNGSTIGGTISFADWCLSSGTISGTISGNQLSLNLAFSGGQKVSFTGATNLPGVAITGQYTVETGTCVEGSTGGIAIGKN
jgi:uncharacterized protein (TIGR03437 family)